MSATSDEPEEREPEYEASLRVWSKTLSVAELSSHLGEPSASHQRGDVRTDLPKWGIMERHPESLWLRESGVDQSNGLGEHIESLLAFVESSRLELDAIREACDIDITCSVFQNGAIFGWGFVIEPELSRRLAEVALPLKVNSY